MMNLQRDKYIRIRGEDGYEMNLEVLVKSIEFQFKTDITSLPNWKELLKRIGDKQQDYKSNIQKAMRRKFYIIGKLCMQNFRVSPFSLTNNLARTAYVWKEIEDMTKRRIQHNKKTDIPSIDLSSDTTVDLSDETSEMKLRPHPNSEILQSEGIVEPILPEPAAEVETKSSVTHLPAFVCTNQHKVISPLESQFSGLNKIVTESNKTSSLLLSRNKDWTVISHANYIISKPSRIEIDKSILGKQLVTFYLTNSSTEALYVQFKTISDISPFKKANILPKTPIKLRPGLSASFKFIFKLVPNVNNLHLYLYFRIGRNVNPNVPIEHFKLPVSLKISELEENIFVTEIVNIIPVYSWQVNFKSNFPNGNLNVFVDNDNCYYMHIKKHMIDFMDNLDNDTMSVDLTGLNSDSVKQRMEDVEFDVDNTFFCQLKKEIQITDTTEPISLTGIIYLIVEDIVQLALDTFIFVKTFVYLHPRTKCTIPVLFCKAEYVGFHQSCYDLDFYNSDTGSLEITKTIKIFAEVLANPIQIRPTILDMSESTVNFGVREDRFIVTNTHKIYPAMLKINITKRMKQLFQISPMEMEIPYSSSAYFLVKACSSHLYNDKIGDLVHFTIKINITGHESVYRNVPPIFYEIILPCASEFKKIYNDY